MCVCVNLLESLWVSHLRNWKHELNIFQSALSCLSIFWSVFTMRQDFNSLLCSARPLKSSWLWRASLPRRGTQSRWIHSTNSFVRKSSHISPIWIQYGSKSFQYGCCIQVRTSYLPNEIIWGFRWARNILFFRLFHFENMFVENISDLSTLVWPMIRRWPNMSWTRPTSMQPSLTAPQGETF